jgi:dienelactone hydrolase
MTAAGRPWKRPGLPAVCLATVVGLAAAGEQAERGGGSLAAKQQQQWRSQIRTALFIPDPLPPLAARTHGQFEPEAGVVAERVSYASQFGLRVTAILYRPRQPKGKVPAPIVVNGHGGDKYSWYAFYAGVLYARAGAAVLTFDPIGEGERHRERRSGTRAHDQKLEPREMGRRLGGLLITDVMQAVSYLRSRPEVDPRRLGAVGYSLGSFLVALTGAVDPRLHACVLAGGGNLDGPDGYWDRSKPMCQGIPYQALGFLRDRPAALYALHASRGPTLILNGLEDSVVGIPQHGHGEAFFNDLQKRTARFRGTSDGVFEFQLIPKVSHRPFFVTLPAALWLQQHLDFPNWSQARIRSMPQTHITRWATAFGVPIDRSYAGEDREGGTRAVGENVPALSRAQLSVFSRDDWEKEKGHLIYEKWVEAARTRVKEGPR